MVDGTNVKDPKKVDSAIVKDPHRRDKDRLIQGINQENREEKDISKEQNRTMNVLEFFITQRRDRNRSEGRVIKRTEE